MSTKPLRKSLEKQEDQTAVWAAVNSAQREIAAAVHGYQESAASPSSYKLSLEDPALQKNVEQWFRVISRKPGPNEKTVGVAITINGRLEKIDWYGMQKYFRGYGLV